MTIINKFSRGASIITLAAFLGACATSSKDITASYVSPMHYQTFDCDQIAQESVRVQARVTELGGRLDEAASNDQGIAVAGAILFWPALFFLGGTKNQEAEYGRLKGEYEALQQQAILKKCSPSSHIHTTKPLAPAGEQSPEAAPVPGEAEPTRYKLMPQPI